MASTKSLLLRASGIIASILVLLFLWTVWLAPAHAGQAAGKGPADGQASPVLPSEDGAWDERFGPPGVDGTVYAIAISGTHVYVGGDFAKAGTVTVNNIAMWNGTAWSALVTGEYVGLEGIVRAITISGDDVYVGGDFESAGGDYSSLHVVRWDGVSWHALGDGIEDWEYGTVRALAVVGPYLYAGGDFQFQDEPNVPYLARWDGVEWSPVGGGVTGPVYALAANGSDLYAGGDFILAGSMFVHGIARWDGSAWSPLGTGVNGGSVRAIAFGGSNVYAGGFFNMAGGIVASGVARWNGSAWSSLGTGSSNGVNNIVQALAVSGNDVYAGGLFTRAGAWSTNYIARWNGYDWLPLGDDIYDRMDGVGVWAIAARGSDVYAGGIFSTVGEVRTNRMARWDGEVWSSLGNSVDGSILAIAVSGSDVYVGGGFKYAGGIRANNVARWDGSAWHPLGAGVGGGSGGPPCSWCIRAIGVNGSDVYVGGYFTTAGGQSAKGIARWDGAEWHALGSGVTGFNPNASAGVHSIAFIGTAMYVAGGFYRAGGVSVDGIARWDTISNTWSSLGTVFGSAHVIVRSGNDLFVGGYYQNLGGTPQRVAKFNGASWSFPVNGDMDSSIQAISAIGTDAYVGGSFRLAGGVSTRGVVRWDTTNDTFHPLGSGADGTVSAFATWGSDLYVGGSFRTAGGRTVNNIARWDGTDWHTLGSGIGGDPYVSVEALAVGGDGRDVYVGGYFTTAGGVPSYNFAIYHRTLDPTPTATPTNTAIPSPTETTPPATATPPACTINFSDVAPTDYFYEPVRYLFCAGAVSGYADGTFRPYNNTTRGQLSKIVVLAEGWPIDTTGGPHFSDVPETNPFYTFIETAFNRGVISGYLDGAFRPNNNVTRAQLAKIIVLAEGWAIDTTGGPHFSDVPLSDPFYSYIETALNRGVISGYADGTFKPGNPAVRAQIAKIVYSAVIK